jgi:glucan 1,3-beta-glucosidase
MNIRDKSLRGVNLGGWLVLERWMTPSLFAGTDAEDEYSFMRTPGAAEKIAEHHRTFITEDDFRWLADHGVNALRIPIGYWLFGDEAPYAGSIDRLDWAVRMAKKYQIQVLLCLHGAPGSQNGQHHSGKKGPADWFHSASNREKTIQLLERLALHYRDEPAIWGIELLNEPKLGLLHLKLRLFYQDAYRRLIQVARPGTHIVFHDAFTPRLLSGALVAHPDYPVVMDIHWYQFGSLWERFESLAHYFGRVGRRVGLIHKLERRQPVIIGEWSVVISGKVLARKGALTEAESFRRHGLLQAGVYGQALGWFYWTYKTEGRGIWHFRSQVEDGVLNL